MLATEHDALRCPLERQDVLEELRTVHADRLDEALGARRHVGVAVDLAVRVVQGHADRLAAILEGEHLRNARQRAEELGAVRPRLDHRARAGDCLRAERSLVLRAEADDLTAPE